MSAGAFDAQAFWLKPNEASSADTGTRVAGADVVFPALITALFVIVGMLHFIKGTRIMIDDYFQGGVRKGAIIFSVIFGWAVIAAAVYALARMGLGAIVVL